MFFLYLMLTDAASVTVERNNLPVYTSAVLYSCLCLSGGLQETEAVLCDVWRAGLSVAALWSRTSVRRLLHFHRVPTVLRTDPQTAALLTPQQLLIPDQSVLIPHVTSFRPRLPFQIDFFIVKS